MDKIFFSPENIKFYCIWKKMFSLVSGFMNIMLEKPLYKILIIGEESVGKTVNEIIIFNL